MSEDVTGDDEDGDVTVNTHVKGYVTLARSGSLKYSAPHHLCILIGQGLREGRSFSIEAFLTAKAS